ncbi:hypothetical protein L208DRAFT_784221 [Tricholoma matsutake]|nr:hypothetical protein L208DRAFT_784221 [Tricholoma matsutake 945]
MAAYHELYPFFVDESQYDAHFLQLQAAQNQSQSSPGAWSPAYSTPQQHMLSLAGSFDAQTGIFYRTPEHPRLRTAQACEKCRTRKAKCSGEHPSCKRCILRNLTCEYAKEGRVRGPNKPKLKIQPDHPSASSSSSTSPASPKLPSPSRKSVSSSPTINQRSTRQRPPNLRLDSSSNHYRLDSSNNYHLRSPGMLYNQHQHVYPTFREGSLSEESASSSSK